MAGGLNDQHPGLIDRFYYIFAERSKEQEKQRKAEERKNRNNTPGGSRPAGRGRRR